MIFKKEKSRAGNTKHPENEQQGRTVKQQRKDSQHSQRDIQPLSQEVPQASPCEEKLFQERPGQSTEQECAWEKREFQVWPKHKQDPQKSGSRKREYEGKPKAKQEPQTSPWGKKEFQDRPKTEQGPQRSAWGKKEFQDQPGPSTMKESAWGKKEFQDLPKTEQGPQRSAWEKKEFQDQPGPSSQQESSESGEKGEYYERAKYKQKLRRSSRGKMEYQDMSQQALQRYPWGGELFQDQPGPSFEQESTWKSTIHYQLIPQALQGIQGGPPLKVLQEKSCEEVENVTRELSKLGRPSSDFSQGYTFAPRNFSRKKSGRPIVVATNFYHLKIINPDMTVYDYSVKIEPPRPKHLLREVWKKFVEQEFPGRLTAFNGITNAYSNGPLMNEPSTTNSVTIFNVESKKERSFNVVVSEARRVSMKCFENFRENSFRQRAMKILPEAETSILDIILKDGANECLIRSGRNFFPPIVASPRTSNLSNKLLMNTGHFQTAALGYDLFLNFDIAHRAFYRPLTMLEVSEIFTTYSGLMIAEMESFIRGVKIRYQLPNDPSLRFIHKVNGFVKNAHNQTFKLDDEKEITVAEYFETEKKVKLQFPELPLLWVGSKRRTVYLPMEFCTILPDQVYKGAMNLRETNEMVLQATSNARTRRDDINKLFEDVNINERPLMKEFGLRVSENMERVEGRVLDAPKLKSKDDIKVDDGKWNIKEFLVPMHMQKWCVVNLDKTLPKDKLEHMQMILQQRARNFNMRIGPPTSDILQTDPTRKNLNQVFGNLTKMELVIVVLPDRKGIYGRVKSICETRHIILTQCIKSKTLLQNERRIPSTIDNILLKINAKLGGVNVTLDENSIPPCMKGNVMIVGADVSHSSQEMNIPSVAAVAVSCDETAFKYSCTTRVQPKGEIIINLEEIMAKHLEEFNRLRNCYPDKIMFYRDGVSEGEMEKVFRSELMAVKRACVKIKNCRPKITFVVVQKRHHTRFYPESKADETGANFNVPPGTCIDSKIVHPRDMDFYLVSHASILGTARPTRYRLLYDDNQLTDEELEKVTYYLCHLYSRCTRAVSYPSPTYNAHLAAYRVRAYLEDYTGSSDLETIQKDIEEHISIKAPMFFV